MKKGVGRRPVPFAAAAAFIVDGIPFDVVLAKPTVAQTVALETIGVECRC